MESLPEDVREIVLKYTVKGAKVVETVSASDNEKHLCELCTDMVAEISNYCHKDIDAKLFIKIFSCGFGSRREGFKADSPMIRAMVNAHCLLGVGKIFYKALTTSSNTDNTVKFLIDFLELYKVIDIPMIASKEMSEVFAIEGLQEYFKILND